ncbi:hypothetical protein CPB86DRAFT_792700 [Serendipita vermifera]|nr:hypothetical protein CPB86DRAFT_792700 [Serendipita vermifera]
MPARRNPAQSNSRSTAKKSTKKTDQQYDCFICTSSSQDYPLKTVTLDSTTLRAHDDCIRAIPELEASPASPTTTTTTLAILNTTNYRKRSSLKCSVCRDGHGVKIQCVAAKCARAFHVNCASESQGIHFELLEGSGMPYKLLCRMHNSTMRRKQWATIRRKKDDLINIYMANVSEGDTVTVNLKREGHCIMEIVNIDYSNRTLDVISELAQRDGQMDETAIRTVEWKQIVIKDSDTPAALSPQMDPQSTTASPEPSPLPPVAVTSATFIPSPSRSPSPSLIEWEQESRGIQSALFPASTSTSASIMNDADDGSQSSPSVPTSDSGSDRPRSPPSSLVRRAKADAVMMDSDSTSPSLCSDATQEEDEDLWEYTPEDLDSPSPSYSGSTTRPDSSTEREDNTKMYLPPLYVLNPAEIQQACQALFTLPNWNNLINQAMADCAPSHLNNNNNNNTSHPSIPAV